MAASKACLVRLQKEYKQIVKDPVPCITAHPSPTNILDWHFVLEGKDDFEGGVYHGRLTFPPQYPYKPPSLSMITPSGRFEPNQKICMSMTDFHPESWNPMWSVGTILNGLLSFMYDSAMTTGAVQSTPEEKRALARASLDFNLRSPIFKRIFPEWVEKAAQREREGAAADAGCPTTDPARPADPAPGDAADGDGPQGAPEPVPDNRQARRAAARKSGKTGGRDSGEGASLDSTRDGRGPLADGSRGRAGSAAAEAAEAAETAEAAEAARIAEAVKAAEAAEAAEQPALRDIGLTAIAAVAGLLALLASSYFFPQA